MKIDRDDSGRVLSCTFRRPSNFHAHLRREALMEAIAKHMMQWVLYLLVMPNTNPHIRTMADALAYHDELMAIAKREGFTLLRLIMTLYHTADITPKVIEEIAKSAVVRAVKHYPPHKGATTGSGEGVPLEECHYMLDAMEANGVPLLGHFESVYDKQGRLLPHPEREGYYVDNHLPYIRDRHPLLKICFEHASTRKAVQFVKDDTSGRTVLTATPQHLFLDASAFRHSWGVHLKCMPIPKTPDDRDAVLEFAISGDERAIAGDDSAPHRASAKDKPFDEAASGCFSPHAIAIYASAFDRVGALGPNFEKFMSLNGPMWWGLPPPAEDQTLTIERRGESDVPDPVPIPGEDDSVIPLGWSRAPDRLRIGFAVAA